eukprot:Trichotokara_eunicae@DN4740_c0_g1_i1.p2
MIAAVTLINAQNQPICTEIYVDEQEISVELAFFCALDLLEDKCDEVQSGGIQQADPCLGYICPAIPLGGLSAEYRIYGYCTTTGVKILAMTEEGEEASIRNLLKELHRLYVDAVSNPLMLGRIDTPNFVKSLDRLVRKFGKPSA